MFLDLRAGGGNLLGLCWEPGFPSAIGLSTAAGGVSPKDAKESSLSQILEGVPHPRYFLSPTACRGILRRAQKRSKELPMILRQALEIQAAIPPKVLMQWRVTADGAGLSSPTAFACNQRDEVRNLHDLAGAVQAQPGMKQQTFVAAIPINTQIATRHEQLGEGTGLGIGEDGDPAYTIQENHAHAVCTQSCLTPWDTQQTRIFSENSVAPTVAGADGGGGRNPAGLVFAAFCAGAGSKAGSIGYGTGGNNVPLTLSAPCAFSLDSAESNSMKSSNPHSGCRKVDVARTIDTTVPCPSKNQGGIAVVQETYAITGNAVDRKPHNGGNGLGIQREISPTLTSTDKHCVFSQQRSDEYAENNVTSTQSARQYKDSTDLVCEVAGLDCFGGKENGNLCGTLQAGTSLNKVHPVRIGNLVRRLTPGECELLMGFPPDWTDIPGASDSKRYRALGNSVAIPCVEYIMMGTADVYVENR